MSQYFFILGKNPTLSAAEIFSLLDKKNISFSPKIISKEVFLIDIETKMRIELLIKDLGGVVKIGQILDRVSFEQNEENFFQVFSYKNLKEKYISSTFKKVRFGISIYSASDTQKYLSVLSKKLNELCSLVKDNLSEYGQKSGFIKIKQRIISSVSVAKNQLIQKGVEFVILIADKEILVGKTLSVQEFESFAFRDIKRPRRNKRSGIIPPKLAKIMLNLAKTSENDTFLDPFCGSGTIIQEAILLGCRNIYGSDISDRSIMDTKRNLDWLFQKYQSLNKSSYNISIFQADVVELSRNMRTKSIDVIVTEPFLGPPMHKKPKYSKVQKIFGSLEGLYIKSFREFQKILRTDGRIVIVFPAFFVQNKMQFLDILDEVKKYGFKSVDLLPKKLQLDHLLEITERNSVCYGDKYHFVKREILLFTKT